MSPATRNPDHILQVQGLRAGHGQLVAVRDVSFALKRGACVALIGANGAGKTTLLRCLAGVHPALGGRLHLGAQDITALPAHRRVQQGLALVPEGRRLWADMTVRENLTVALEHRDAARAAAATAPWSIERALQALPGLVPILDRPAGALSGGQRQAAAIARALMSNPEVLLLDEVSLGLSPLVVDEVYRSLQALRAQAGTTLLLVEQDLGRALAFADRVMCLREGQIVLEAACAETTREAVTEAYFGMAHAAPSAALETTP
ncbi:ABC transporter ATP-binding protein [Rubrivivax rivuli]|uniref:ATP-binding cassette domain-containing protein n=1 Tax=Rubrivivax rivuli TaxID=1862385 RepID=A0A437RM10_9BURK|nr:ATP-binding cassette domain-containing protein [Rubrivivax rivuli]RVU47605.1 ATP-binding cassette domain-containing protein [Rubrivivax rivuli]